MGGITSLHGFAPALTNFVGRRSEVKSIADLLEEHRLVTITGPGGVGKTRLAVEVSQRVVDRFADGAWFVELAAVQEPSLVPVTVAGTLGVQQGPDQSLLDVLRAAMARMQILLVLDNCEHLADAVAQLCRELLIAADDMRILATSREPVGIAGEARYRLPPLALPDAANPADSGESEAVRLFIDRARQADAHFISRESELAVAQLVTRLDGIPLAIELAAARVEAFGLPQLVDRLDDRFRLLVGADRTAAPRHRSLEAAVQWSYQLLSEQEQEIFCRLAMFPGPFTLEAAESVAGPAAGQTVLHFVDCSLLIPPRDAGSRYLMLQTLRAFGLDRLAKAGQRPRAIAAVIAYAVRLAEDAATGLDGSGQEAGAAQRLDAESAITQQALAWALEDEPVTAVRLAVALAPWWLLRGQSGPGYSLLQRATQQVGSGGSAWRIGTLWLGHLAHATSNYATALEHFTTVLGVLAPAAPSAEEVDALVGRSGALRNLERVPDAADDARRALGLARELGYPAGETMALVELSWASIYAADAAAAADWASQAQRIDPAGIPDSVARQRLQTLATAFAETGQAAPARLSCADLLTRAQAAGDLGVISYCLWLMAELDLQTDQLTDVPAHLHESLRLATQTGEVLRLLDCLETCGYMCVVTGRWADALTIWAARDREDSFLLPGELQRRQEPARKAARALGPAQARAAEERGQAMNLVTATEFATVLTAPDSELAPAAPALTELSAREQELVTLVARGSTDAQIAGELFISISTVRSHLDRIRDKTSCRRRADLTRLALQAGLV